MVKDIQGPEWPFIRFQNLDLVVKSLEWFWTIPKLTVDCMSCLCVDMLLLGLNNMLCCLSDALGNPTMDCRFVY